jgi:hypothetical protein
VNASISLTQTATKVTMAKKAEKKSTLRAASLATGLPASAPTLTQHHNLQAASLETSSPVMKPADKRVHHLEAGDSTSKKKRAGRHRKLVEVNRLQAELRNWLPSLPQMGRKQKREEAIKYVKSLARTGASDRLINRQIVSQVLKIKN